MSTPDPRPNREPEDELKARSETARAGGSAKYAEKLRQEHKLPVRRRLELLLDPDFLIFPTYKWVLGPYGRVPRRWTIAAIENA